MHYTGSGNAQQGCEASTRRHRARGKGFRHPWWEHAAEVVCSRGRTKQHEKPRAWEIADFGQPGKQSVLDPAVVTQHGCT